MSTYNANPNQLGRAATYQAVIIALVAGAILVIALMSLVWRRRRRAQFLEHVNRARTARDESRWGWVEMADGRLVQIRQRDRTKAKGEVGRQPQVWDVGLGNREADEYLPVEGLERGWEGSAIDGEGRGGRGVRGRVVGRGVEGEQAVSVVR